MTVALTRRHVLRQGAALAGLVVGGGAHRLVAGTVPIRRRPAVAPSLPVAIGRCPSYQPDRLLAGRNGVCTDAIAAAAMGYDPAAPHGQFPFMGDNHLQLLADQGVGTNVVDQIDVRGVPLSKATVPFNSDRRKIGTPLFS